MLLQLSSGPIEKSKRAVKIKADELALRHGARNVPFNRTEMARLRAGRYRPAQGMDPCG